MASLCEPFGREAALAVATATDVKVGCSSKRPLIEDGMQANCRPSN
jgi:hypothetical protein